MVKPVSDCNIHKVWEERVMIEDLDGGSVRQVLHKYSKSIMIYAYIAVSQQHCFALNDCDDEHPVGIECTAGE